MKKENMIVLREEFPFLPTIEEMVRFNALEGRVQIARLDRAFLLSIPADESYRSSAGESDKWDSLFVVKNGEVKKIDLSPAVDHSTGYAHDKAYRREGDSYLSSLVSAVAEFDFLVHYHEQTCSWLNGYDESVITILKKSKHSSLNEEWERALSEARKEVAINSDL